MSGIVIKNKDWVKASWEQRRRLAIELGKSIVEDLMENYHEPSRAGTRKGNPIGLSRKKKRAAVLMILYNPRSGLGINEIARIAHVSPGVARVWRTQRAFIREAGEACDWVRELILNTIHNELVDYSPEDGRKEPFLEIKGIGTGQARYFLLKLLPFFSPLVAYPVMGSIIKKIESSVLGYAELGFMLSWILDVKDEKRYQKWRSQPEIKEFMRFMIDNWIDLISDPEAMKELGPEKHQEEAKKFKKFIFEELDL